jgi:NADH-quinone oxidoreductase subunit N
MGSIAGPSVLLSSFLAAGVPDAAAFRDSILPALKESLSALGAECTLAIGACVVLLADLGLSTRRSRVLAWPAFGVVLAALGVVLADRGEERSIFLGMYARDSLGLFFKGFFLSGTLFIIVLSRGSAALRGRKMGEFYFLLLSAVLGAMLMSTATHFLMMFIAMEILSIASYVLVGYLRADRRGAEASLKYVIYGSIAAAVMAYGFSLWFGLTGSGGLGDMADVVPAGADAGGRVVLTVLVAFLCIFAGLAFKMSVVPMHFWAPDVYEGAPTVVTAFLSVVSKAAGFALALRFLGSLAAEIAVLDPAGASARLWRLVDWRVIVAVASAATMTIGNLAALRQTNLKRLLAYSSIAHAGYILMGLTLLVPGASEEGIRSVAFYLLAYLAMNLGAFAVVIQVENTNRSVALEAFSGMGRSSPWLAVSLTVFLFSLIGVPPTAGFMGKFQIFLGVLAQGGRLGEAGDPLWWVYPTLAVIAVVNTAVSAYYYLKIAKVMYFEAASGEAPAGSEARFPLDRGTGLVVAVLVLLTFYLCLQAGPVLDTTLKLNLHP